MFEEKEREVRGRHDLGTVSGKVSYVKEMVGVIIGLNNRDELPEAVQIIAGAVGLPIDTIRREYVRQKKARIPYGKEAGGGKLKPEEFPPTCHNCGVKIGKLHRRYCDLEECPLCHTQLLWCGCVL